MAETFSNKNMQLWSEVEVKEWINTLPKLNDKQKKTINAVCFYDYIIVCIIIHYYYYYYYFNIIIGY